MLASKELCRRHKNQARQFKTGGKQLADFLESVDNDEVLLVQRLRDRDTRGMRTGIGEVKVDGHRTPSGQAGRVRPIISELTGEQTDEFEIYGEF